MCFKYQNQIVIKMIERSINFILHHPLWFLTFLFIFNMIHRLTLRLVIISFSNESLSAILVHSLSNRNIFKYEYLTHNSHLYHHLYTWTRHACLKLSLGRLSIQRSNCTHLNRLPSQAMGSDTTCWENSRRKQRRDHRSWTLIPLVEKIWEKNSGEIK